MRTILLFLVMVMALFFVSAQAFTVNNDDGFPIKYEILSAANREVKVVGGGTFNSSKKSVNYHMPSTVTYEDITFNIVEYEGLLVVYGKNIYFDEGVRKIERFIPAALCSTVGTQPANTYPTDLYLPSTLEEIGDEFMSGEFADGFSHAFDFDEYQVNVHLSASLNLNTIKPKMFSHALSIDTIILDGVETIEAGAFNGVQFRDANGQYVTELVLPETVKTIGECAFSTYKMQYSNLVSCQNSINRLVIPASVEYIAPAAFCGLGSEVVVDQANANYCNVDGILYTKDMKTLCHYPPNKPGIAFIVPESVESMYCGSMCDVKELRDLTLNNNYNYVPLDSRPSLEFYFPIFKCRFDNVIYGENMTEITQNITYYCNVNRVTIPNSVLEATYMSGGNTVVIESGDNPLTVTGTNSRMTAAPANSREYYVNRPIKLTPEDTKYANAIQGYKNIFVATSQNDDLSWLTGTHYGTTLHIGSNPPACSLEFTEENYAFQMVNVPQGTLALYQAHPVWGKFLRLQELATLVNNDDLPNPPVNGDMNGDMQVNVGDVSELYNAILNGATDSLNDINGDGNVNTGDVSALYKVILGNDGDDTVITNGSGGNNRIPAK